MSVHQFMTRIAKGCAALCVKHLLSLSDLIRIERLHSAHTHNANTPEYLRVRNSQRQMRKPSRLKKNDTRRLPLIIALLFVSSFRSRFNRRVVRTDETNPQKSEKKSPICKRYAICKNEISVSD